MNNKFLDKVVDQIMSETSIIDNKLHTPFSFLSLLFSSPILVLRHSSPSFDSYLLFSSHCKDVYSLNKDETEYVWEKYKKEIVSIINDKELVWIINS